MTWGAGQRAVAQSGAWGPSQHPARWGGLSAEMHGWRMPESMQHELQDCPPHAPQTARVHPECPQRCAQERARPCPPPRSPNCQSAFRVSPEMGPGEGQAQPSSIRGQSPRALTPSVDSQDLGSAHPPRTSRGLSGGMSSRRVSQHLLRVTPG